MKLRRTAGKVYEADIQTQCKNYMIMMGWYGIRLNSGAVRTQSGSLFRGADPGTPDYLFFKQRPQGMANVFIEFKALGKKPTPLQQQKMAELRSHGAICWVIDGLEVLQEKLANIDKVNQNTIQ
jgi:hypothetical protein